MAKLVDIKELTTTLCFFLSGIVNVSLRYRKVRHFRQDDSNNFLTLLELQTSIELKICPLKYRGLLTASSLERTHR